MKTIATGMAVMAAALCIASCSREPGQGADNTPLTEDGFHAVARMTVPCGTREVVVETYALDNNGHRTGVSSKKVAVTPKVAAPEGGKDVEPFGEVTLLLQAPNKTLASVTYTIGGSVPPINAITDLHVDLPGSGVTKADGDPVTVELPEPASYEAREGDQTVYHSSGTVMFDDRWPALPHEGSAFNYDYNDVVIDYDIEALTVADSFLASDGWREQVKVTLHVRAVGGDDAYRAGMVLENFNMDYVEKVVDYKTLDSWQNPHGTLPQWTETTLQENSLHYDNSNLRPAVEIGGLQRLNSKDGNWSKSSGKNSGNEVYQYDGVDHVFNPARKLYSAWGGAHADQYTEDALKAAYQETGRTLSGIQGMKLYNTVPGYVNVNGGLYTYTVIYKMKPRAEMTPEESQKCLSNMIDAVVNTTAQNFFIVKQDYGAVGLKGYEPLDQPVKDYNRGYKAKYLEIVGQYSANMDPSTYYKAANGMVWAFKCPTLTRHAWELMPFNKAYPHYEEWVSSNGAEHADWYTKDVNGNCLTCWW